MFSGDPGRMLSGGDADNVLRTSALNQFKKARQQAALESIISRLRGRSADLLAFNEIADALLARGRSERGLQDIPVKAIVGSVGRYNDFTRSFLPRHNWDAQRWANVKTAGHVSDLPPIEVYQIGEAYFVLDGNHRVSIARQLGVEFLNASVIEVHTRVPLSADVQPDELIIKAELAAFLAHTRLDELRPLTNLQLTVPGKYARLENHIEVHRFFIEMAEDIELSDNEAVVHWHDQAYLPFVEAIREQGILRDFPDRTEADLYLWFVAHQTELRNLLGWEVRPATAVTQLKARLKEHGRHPLRRIYEKVLNVFVPDGWQGQQLADWTQERLLDRYSQSLFAEILVPLSAQAEQQTIEQALLLAEKENGRLVGFCFGGEVCRELRDDFYGRCQARGVESVWAEDATDLQTIMQQRAGLADLIVLPKAWATEAVIEKCARPLLLVPHEVSPLAKALLLADHAEDSGLFAATYLAELGHTALVVISHGDQAPIQAYLEMHEVAATWVGPTDWVETAVAHHCDFIIVSRKNQQFHELCKLAEMPVLIC